MNRLVLEMLELDYKRVSENIEDFIRRSVDLLGKNGVIVGLSGGLDSSTVATLSVRALGNDRVFGLLMPERDSEPQNFKDAKQLASMLKIEYEVLDVTPILRKMGIYDLLPDKIAKNKKLLMERLREAKRVSAFEAKPSNLPIIGIKSGSLGYCFTFPKVRLRSIMLYYRACLKKLVVAGTITKSEYVTSTYDEHGDGACEIAPLRNLYKSQVRRLAQYLGVPNNIVTKPSSPDLIAGAVVTDEILIGMKYETLDSILYCLERGMGISEIAGELGVEENTVERVANTVEMAKLRREMPLTPHP
ncbi:MAG: NAD(+) synthase [Candidatus Freyarchaeota archaeon]|nr:NAD(+) synthase [Candidatus Jordarchaeia archaeon]MBS7267681.1 NAD(+) synthase [Candidatus Jordarchaeia archaeon]MBS7278851.1 NAD(+) synthase [Candidatus Jordarchaeia archaeon]